MIAKIPDIRSVEQFLAHVHAVKCESEDRLQDLSDCLFQHHNLLAADIFSQTVILIQANIKYVESLTKGMSLPDIPPWEYLWQCKDQPESLCIEQAHYLMTPIQALELAIFNEQRLSDFCQYFSQKSHSQQDLGVEISDTEISHVATKLYSKEKQALDEMNSWRKDLDRQDISTKIDEDFDPPNMPE